MSTFLGLGQIPGLPYIVKVPTIRGITIPLAGYFYDNVSLPTDPIGINSLALIGIVIGSRVHITNGYGTIVFDVVTTSSSNVYSIPVYEPGLIGNNLIIKIRNASSYPAYQPYQTQIEAFVGSQSIFISQVLD